LGSGFSGKGYGSGYSLLSSANVVIALLTYLRQAVVADVFGLSWKTDAFAVAMVFPTLMRQIVGHSFNSTFLPVYSDVLENKGRGAADRLLGRVLTWIGFAGSLMVALLLLFSRELIGMAGPGLSTEGTLLSADMLRILAPVIILAAVNGTLDALLMYRHRYVLVSALRIGSVGLTLLTVVLGHAAFGIYVLPLSGLAGPLLVFPVALLLTSRGGRWPRLAADPRESDFATLLRMAAPVTLATVVGFMGPIFDKMLASYLRSSSVTALEYANRIKMVAHAILIGPLISLADVQLSRKAARQAVEELKRAMLANVRWSTFITLPFAIMMTTLAVPLVVALFRRGSFTVSDAGLVGYALAFYAPWLAQFGAGAVVSRGFYALKDTLTPVLIGVWAMVCNVLLNFILVGPLGVGGLALATTLSSTAKTAFLYYSFRRKVGPLGARRTVVEHLRILLAGTAMVGVILLLDRAWPFDLQAGLLEVAVRVGAAAALGSAAYLSTAFAVGSLQVKALSEKIRSALGP
jgi:putative peptidoglycan lipid II flippase